MSLSLARILIRGTVLLALAGTVPACTSGGRSGAPGQSANSPDTFSLISPASGDQNVSPSTGFSWQASAGANSYTLEVATDSVFSRFVIHARLTGTSFTPTTPLVPGMTYYWQVEAENGSGTSFSQGAPWSFTTQADASAPGEFQLSSPASGSTVTLGGAITNAQLYNWTSSAGAMSYTLEVASDSGFMNIVLSQSGITQISYPPSGVAPGGTYYWRVYAVNASGATLAKDAPWSFQVSPFLAPGS